MKKSITTFVASIITLLCFGQAKTYFHDRIDTTVFAVADTVGHGANNYYATNTSPDFNVNHYENGLSVILFVKKGNTGTATLTLVTRTGTLSTRSIRKAPGAVLASGDIKDSSLTLFTYYNGHWRLGDMVPASSSSWMLTGNAGTTAGTNFLGTTDAQDVVFKRNSSEVMRLYSANNYVGIGLTTPTARLNVLGSGTTTATYSGLFENSSGTDLFGVRDDGFMYGGNATTKSLIIGQNSSASMALSGNTFFGVDCGKTGNFNTALGYAALVASTGDQSTAVGSGALQNATAGFNTAIGKNALVNTSTGFGNVAIGNEAGTTMTGATFNVLLGYQAGYYETGSSKLFIDNNQRASEADGRVKALVYGVFDAAVTNQTLRFNASVGINSAPAASTQFTAKGSGATSATYTALFENSAGTDLVTFRDDGVSFFGTTAGSGKVTIYNSNNAHLSMSILGGTADRFLMYLNSATEDLHYVLNNAKHLFYAGGGGGELVLTVAGAGATNGRVSIAPSGSGNYLGNKFYVETSANNDRAIYGKTLGAGGTADYAGYFEAVGAGTLNIAGYFTSSGATNNIALQVGAGRVLEFQGTDIASSSTVTLTNGNVFELTGTTTVNFITTTAWQEGAEITLIANENVTINDDAGGGNIRLAGNANFSMTADDVLTLVYSSTTAGGSIWREKSRSVN